MSTLTFEATPHLDGDRGVDAQAETQREATRCGVGKSCDPEVASVAQRRKFSDSYKIKLLDEIDDNPGMAGLILRREGLYSSNLSRWRHWRNMMGTETKSVSVNKQMHNDMAKLQRENSRLTMKLKKAEALIELQKKTSELLEMMSRSASDEK